MTSFNLESELNLSSKVEGKHSSTPSFVSELLDEGNLGNEEAEAMIRDCAALAYGGLLSEPIV